ncbi:metal tolerance protein 1-like protein [Tanacetum coccineum]
MDIRHDHRSINISVEAQSTNKTYIGTTVCAGGGCGLTDAKNSSKESKERSSSMWKLLAGIIICFLFMTVEVVGGIKANSLAVLTDAAHLLSDIAAFGISLFSVWASGWVATPRQSYGYFRIEILRTLVSIQIIWLLTGILVYQAIDRLVNGLAEVDGGLMFGISAVGLVVSIFMIFILGHEHGHGHDDHDHKHGLNVTHHDGHNESTQPLLRCYPANTNKPNINVRGTYLHVLGDSIQSIGVMTVFYTTINILRDILEVLMESTPREIDATRLENGLCAIDEVVAIHELHIWAITVGKVLLACHVKIRHDGNAEMVLD